MKKIIIVGASSGIGYRVARDFALKGWHVGMAARREKPLKELQREFPDRVVYKTMDVTTAESVGRFNDLIEQLGGMDVMLYAAGTGFQNTGLDLTREMVTLETNVLGMARITLASYKYFRDTATSGRIAVITSVASTKGIGVAAAYSASKRFQCSYLEALEQLANRQGVNVKFIDIRPGFVRTALLDPNQDYPMIMSLDHAAPLVEQAISKGKRVATVDWRWRLLTAMWRLIPSRLWVRMNVGLTSPKAVDPTEGTAVAKASQTVADTPTPAGAVARAATGIVDNDPPVAASEADAENYFNKQPTNHL